MNLGWGWNSLDGAKRTGLIEVLIQSSALWELAATATVLGIAVRGAELKGERCIEPDHIHAAWGQLRDQHWI